jgi:hypothetical protein
MNTDLTLRIILESPTVGVDYGLQEGKWNNYTTVQKKRSDGKDVIFEFKVKYKIVEGIPVFLGPFVQGPVSDRFIYVDIGTLAGQKDSVWTRRIKIPLISITSEMVQHFLSGTRLVIEASIPGKGKGGGPNCGTIKPFDGWKLKQI